MTMDMPQRPSPVGTTVILTCAGSANVGRIAELAAADMQQEGLGGMLGLDDISNQDAETLLAIRNAERIVGVDGCSNACVRKALEKAGLALTDHVVVTDLGVQKKTHDGVLDSTAIARIRNAIKARLETVPGGPFCC